MIPLTTLEAALRGVALVGAVVAAFLSGPAAAAQALISVEALGRRRGRSPVSSRCLQSGGG